MLILFDNWIKLEIPSSEYLSHFTTRVNNPIWVYFFVYQSTSFLIHTDVNIFILYLPSSRSSSSYPFFLPLCQAAFNFLISYFICQVSKKLSSSFLYWNDVLVLIIDFKSAKEISDHFFFFLNLVSVGLGPAISQKLLSSCSFFLIFLESNGSVISEIKIA